MVSAFDPFARSIASPSAGMLLYQAPTRVFSSESTILATSPMDGRAVAVGDDDDAVG